MTNETCVEGLSRPYRRIGARGRCVAFSCRAYADRPLLCLPSRRLLPLGRAAQEGTPHAVLSPGQARRVRDRRAVDLTRLAGVWDVASRRSSGSQRLGYDRSASEAHAAGRMPTLPPSPRRGTRYRAGSAVRVTSPALFIGRWDDDVELPEALWIHEGIDLRDLSVSDGERHHGKHSSGGRHHNSRGAVDEH